jgi:hypothetical protein
MNAGLGLVLGPGGSCAARVTLQQTAVRIGSGLAGPVESVAPVSTTAPFNRLHCSNASASRTSANTARDRNFSAEAVPNISRLWTCQSLI